MATNTSSPSRHAVWDDAQQFTKRDSREVEMQAAIDEWFQTLSDTIGTPVGQALLTEWLQYQTRYPFASTRNGILLLSQLDTPKQLGTEAGWKTTTRQITNARSYPPGASVWTFDSLIDRVCPLCGTPQYAHAETSTNGCSTAESSQWDVEPVKSTPTRLLPPDRLSSPSTSTAQPPYSQPLTDPDEYAIALSENFPTNFDASRLPPLSSPSEIPELLQFLTNQTDLTYTDVSRDEWDHFEIATVTVRDPYTFTPTVKSCIEDTDRPEKHLQSVVEPIGEMLLATTIAQSDPTSTREKKAALTAYAITELCDARAAFPIPSKKPTPSLKRWANLSLSELKQYCTDIRNTITALLIGTDHLRS